MDIKIEAPGHWNQQKLIAYYQEKLTKKYGNYDFIHAIDVKVNKLSDQFQVSLQIRPEKGGMLFAKDLHANENIALEESIRKMNAQIEKYKDKHYRSAYRFKPGF